MNIKNLLNKILNLGKNNNLYKIKINVKELDFYFSNIKKSSSTENPLTRILDNSKNITTRVYDIKTGNYYNYSKTNMKI